MFGLGDDFEIDENFLGEVFEAEKTVSHSSHGIKRRADITQNLEDTHLNILKDTTSSTTFLSSKDNNSSTVINPARNLCQIRDVLTPVPVINSRTNHLFDSPLTKDSSSRKIRPRKFPGPAGLLPERQGNSSLIATEDFLNELEDELNEETTFKEEEILSQDSARNLESPAWHELIQDLGSDGQALLKRLNVSSVCTRAKLTRALKVPFLALLIRNVDASTADPCLYLSDSTGEMVGAVHREVWEKLGQDLVPGTVIVLVNVGVLCAGNSTARHYLNITTNNIAALYSPTSDNDIRVKNVKPLSQPDCSKFLQVWQELLSSPVQQSTNDTNRQLFSTASLSPSPTSSFHIRAHLNSPGNRFCNSVNRSFTSSPGRENSFVDSPSRFSNNSNETSFTDRSQVRRPFQPHFRSRTPVRTSNLKTTNQIHRPHNPVSNCPQPAGGPFVSKRPKFEPSLINDNFSHNASQESAASQSIVDTLLDGIDTDSLFGDF